MPISMRVRAMPMVRMNSPMRCFWPANTCSTADTNAHCQRHCKNPRNWQGKIPHFADRVFRWFVRLLHFWVGVRGAGARRAQVV
jgi:hypothetical protein